MTTVTQRALGSNGLVVSALGLGCMGMSEFYGSSNEEEAFGTIRRALELGVTLIDTADMYGPFVNEELVGRAIAGRRDAAVVATKFGQVRSADGARLGIRGDADYVRSACEASLRRLGVDVIDLYVQHRVDPSVPIEETVGAMADLVQEGKVRFLGLSEAAPATIRRAHTVHPLAAVQTEYALWSREVEERVLPTLRELGIGLVAYAPLGRGFLTGTVRSPGDLEETDSRRQVMPRFQAENLEHNRELVATLEAVAAAHGVTAAQVALSWVLAQGLDIVPIPGTRRVRYLEENVAALDLELSSAELDLLGRSFPIGAAAGERYPAAVMASLER